MSDKETIAVYVPGSPFGVKPGEKEIYRGANTHMRSEGSWMLGMALNMARHGHPTTILEYPWGNIHDYPLPENISLQPHSDIYKGKFDIYLSMGWEDVVAPKRCSGIDAKIFLNGWGGNPRHSTLESYIKNHPDKMKNHYLARWSRCFANLFDTYEYGFYAPTPIVDKIPEKGNFNTKKTLWGNRGAFNPGYKKYSLEILDFMEKYPEYEHTVLLYDDIKQRCLHEKNWYGDGIGGKEGAWIVSRFESLKNKNLIDTYQGLPHDEFLKELGDSKLLLANGQPSCHPQTLEAVCMGAIPLVWNFADHHFKDVPSDKSKYGKELHERDPAYKYPNVEFGINGTDGLDQIMNNEDLYQKYYSELRRVTVDHEFDNAYNIFIHNVKEKLEK